MIFSKLLCTRSGSFNEQQIIIIMLRSWLIKILLCFSHTHHDRRKQQQKSTANSIMKNKGEKPIVSSFSSICHTFSPPLNVSMLRSVRCRTQSRTLDNNLVTSPLSKASLKRQSIAGFLNESQNCAEGLSYEYTPLVSRCKRNSSLIAIDIGDDGCSQEQMMIKHRKQSMNCYSPIDRSRFKSKIRLCRQHSRTLMKLVNSDSSLTNTSYCFCLNEKNTTACLNRSPSSVQKQKSDSIIFVHRHKQRPLTDYSPHNTNTITYDAPLSDTFISIPSSDSDILTPTSQKRDKTWRLQIHDDLNKDGSRHNVVHKGSEESVRKRRQQKRDKRSADKKRKIEERILKANQRWQKYSNIDYELVLFISRYYDQLPLCSNCRNYFVSHRTQFLAEDPRASLDYAADVVLDSPTNKAMTMKQAAKARLIQDYDKQSDILFNLCDTCLNKCEQIRNELKQINFARKMANESDSPTIDMMTMEIPELQQQQLFTSPSLSPSVSDVQDHLFSPTNSSPIPPSPLNSNLVHQQKPILTPPQNTITDLNQIYMNNLIQNHQIRLQQLYQESQNIIVAQQYPFGNNQSQMHYDLQSCIKQMQHHCLAILHLQYPGCSLSFPYTPSFNPQYLSYRHEQSDDESTDTEDFSPSSRSEEEESDIAADKHRSFPVECDENSQSMDDRLTIETCHGLVEYCNAPLDDFIRGLQVLKCLSNFNCYST